jgi:uncharacterized OB-fold protein/acyl dehydratase
MSTTLKATASDAFVIEGKLALPYQYFAGATGSRFLVALRDEHKLLGTRCPTCGKVTVPPRPTCELHPGPATEWVSLPGTGEIAGFTVIRYAEPYQPCKPPYVLALIKLDGADSRLTHVVKGVAPSQVRVGLRVKPVFAKAPVSTLLAIDHFEPDESPFQLGLGYDELEVGMSASVSKTITETDVYLFAGISGDFNPMHVNEQFAKTTPFGTRIAHGALAQSLLAPVLGMKLPGLGTIALEVTARFKAPTHFGDTITCKATVSELLPEKRWVRLSAVWTNQDGQVVATGSALVLPPQKG